MNEFLYLMFQEHSAYAEAEAISNKIREHPLSCKTFKDVAERLRADYPVIVSRTTDAAPMMTITVSTDPKIILKIIYPTGRNQSVKYKLLIDDTPYFFQEGVLKVLPPSREWKRHSTQDEKMIHYDKCFFDDLFNDEDDYIGSPHGFNKLLYWIMEAIKIIKCPESYWEN